jgi:outer membrane protein TolC
VSGTLLASYRSSLLSSFCRKGEPGRDGEKIMTGKEHVSYGTILRFAVFLLLVFSVHAPVCAAAERVDFAEAVTRALKNNAALSAAGHEWASASMEADVARGDYLPNLAFEERFSRTNIPAQAFSIRINQSRFQVQDFAVENINDPDPLNNYMTAFTLTQHLFAPKAFLRYRMAGREAEAKGLDVSRKKEEVVYQVLTSYLDVLTVKEFVRVADQEVSDAREHLRIADALERSGMGLSSDVLRAKVALARAESEKVSTENRLALARRSLGLAMGERGGIPVDAATPVPNLPEAGSLEERIAAVREHRTDLRAFSTRLANADTNVTLERAGYLPTVGVMGVYQMDSHDSPFSPDNKTWSVGMGLSWNLFDGLRREAAAAKAADDRSKAQAHYRGMEDFAAFQVTRAYLSVEEAARRVEIARAAVDAAEEGTRLIKARYENQLSRVIDLLDAQAALHSARADLVRAENDLRQSRAQLEYASGTLLPWALPESTGAEAGGGTR